MFMLCVAAWENPSHSEILPFSTMQSFENYMLPETEVLLLYVFQPEVKLKHFKG